MPLVFAMVINEACKLDESECLYKPLFPAPYLDYNQAQPKVLSATQSRRETMCIVFLTRQLLASRLHR